MKHFFLYLFTFLVVFTTHASTSAADASRVDTQQTAFEQVSSQHKVLIHSATAIDHTEYSIDLEEEEEHIKTNWLFATVLSFYAQTFTSIELPRLECFYFSKNITPSLSRHILFEDFRI